MSFGGEPSEETRRFLSVAETTSAKGPVMGTRIAESFYGPGRHALLYESVSMTGLVVLASKFDAVSPV